ncbi:hypothetical protein HXX01_02535 [Candidatus Nomurabacteria bacterium]|nr:hypothetical protein [Candidatus Nomurabacteria bacterium]
MNLYIFDYTDRNANIVENILSLIKENASLKSFISTINTSENVYDESDNFIIPDEPALVFLHLGDGVTYGNLKSIEYYDEVLKNRKIAVVAYTGGTVSSCPAPEVFNQYAEGEVWHKYFNQIHKSSDLRLDLFLNTWSKNPSSPPPFDSILSNPISYLISLSILCQGFLAANCVDKLPGYQKLSDDLICSIGQIWADKYDDNKNEWWKILNSPNVLNEIKNEWADCSFEKSDVELLLNKINSNAPITHELVLSAYSQLEKRLSKL